MSRWNKRIYLVRCWSVVGPTSAVVDGDANLGVLSEREKVRMRGLLRQISEIYGVALARWLEDDVGMQDMKIEWHEERDGRS